ncbi:MAG: hypothetical protein JWM27_1103 [Gemmatimonadetes bacterium]|nr:hypothetical protein [Gemmatimonadota bacterium]
MPPKKRPRRVWARASPRPVHPKIPDALKRRVQAEGDRLVAETLRPRYVKPPPTDNDFNYVTDLLTKWHQGWFYFRAIYACPSPNAISPTFEMRFARLEYAGGERFNLAFMRYTGEWITIYHDVELDEALAGVRDDAYFTM